jgi:hypothetical protein
MRVLKVLGIAILVIVVLFVVVGFLLPSHAHVERSIDVLAPAEPGASTVTWA